MATIERLLTMGLAHSPNLERLAQGPAGTSTPGVRDVDRIDWTDVAFALGTLTPLQRAIVQLKAVPQHVTANELAALVDHLGRELLSIDPHSLKRTANAQHHDLAERALHRASARRDAAIIRTALDEYQDARTCLRCRSTGQVLDHVEGRGMVKGTCGRCEGKGWVRWSDNKRARGVGCRREHWLSLYASAYEHVLRECTRQYREAATAFKAALFGHPDDPTTPGAIERRLQARC